LGGNFGVAHFAVKFEFDRGHLDPRDSARNYRAEILEIGGHIEREAMQRYPPPEPDADGAYFALAHP